MRRRGYRRPGAVAGSTRGQLRAGGPCCWRAQGHCALYEQAGIALPFLAAAEAGDADAPRTMLGPLPTENGWGKAKN